MLKGICRLLELREVRLKDGSRSFWVSKWGTPTYSRFEAVMKSPPTSDMKVGEEYEVTVDIDLKGYRNYVTLVEFSPSVFV